MRVCQIALVCASLLAAATPAAALTKPPSEPGGGGSTSVPEPGALAMMGTGVAGYGAAVALCRRKKRKQKN